MRRHARGELGAIGAVTIEGLKKKGSGKSTALRVSYSMSD